MAELIDSFRSFTRLLYFSRLCRPNSQHPFLARVGAVGVSRSLHSSFACDVLWCVGAGVNMNELRQSCLPQPGVGQSYMCPSCVSVIGWVAPHSGQRTRRVPSWRVAVTTNGPYSIPTNSIASLSP